MADAYEVALKCSLNMCMKRLFRDYGWLMSKSVTPRRQVGRLDDQTHVSSSLNHGGLPPSSNCAHLKNEQLEKLALNVERPVSDTDPSLPGVLPAWHIHM